ncbi:MAG TPA: hypothetical protein K8V05_11185 [Butyricimonas virosa]|uniref:Uncharacterized protein n=1 Tax=Butyricimonas virosa TaxID=544645 RepID=A0A921H5R2_9BACT|nr:hypothetical protein [Butyricimonas virosa]
MSNLGRMVKKYRERGEEVFVIHSGTLFEEMIVHKIANREIVQIMAGYVKFEITG